MKLQLCYDSFLQSDRLQEVLTISENFPRTNVEERALGTFLEVSRL